MTFAYFRRKELFFTFFVGTIVFVRLALLVAANQIGFDAGIDFHHYMYGSILIVVAPLFRNVGLYAIGWGLLIDELMLFPTNATTWSGYFSPAFLVGTFLLVVFVYVFRRQFVSIFRT